MRHLVEFPSTKLIKFRGNRTNSQHENVIQEVICELCSVHCTRLFDFVSFILLNSCSHKYLPHIPVGRSDDPGNYVTGRA